MENSNNPNDSFIFKFQGEKCIDETKISNEDKEEYDEIKQAFEALLKHRNVILERRK